MVFARRFNVLNQMPSTCWYEWLFGKLALQPHNWGGGYISIQERDGGFTVHFCGALYCELGVQIDCIKMAMEIVKLCRLYIYTRLNRQHI